MDLGGNTDEQKLGFLSQWEIFMVDLYKYYITRLTMSIIIFSIHRVQLVVISTLFNTVTNCEGLKNFDPDLAQ